LPASEIGIYYIIYT